MVHDSGLVEVAITHRHGNSWRGRGGCRSPRPRTVNPTEANDEPTSETSPSRPRRRIPRRIRIAEWLAFAGLIAACLAAIGPAEKLRTAYSWPPLALPSGTPDREWSPLRLPRRFRRRSRSTCHVRQLLPSRCERARDRSSHLPLPAARSALCDHALRQATHVRRR